MLRTSLLLLSLLLSTAALAQRFPSHPHLYVTGEAKQELAPDYAELRFMVARTGADVPATKQDVDAITQRVWAAVREAGVAREDFQATGFTINPMIDFENGRRTHRGTQVSRQFVLKLRDMARFDPLSEALVQAGVQDVPGVQVNVDQRDAKEAALRVRALQNAREQAEQLAAALGQVITGVYTISDTPIGDGGGIRFAMAEMRGAPDEAPTLPDRVELHVQAYVVFSMMAK